MNCPKCGVPMQYIWNGYNLAHEKVYAWRCSDYPCWDLIEERPTWIQEIQKAGLYLALLDKTVQFDQFEVVEIGNVQLRLC